MRKFLRPSDRILLALGLLGDILEDLRDPLLLVSASYKTLYGWVPPQYRHHNFQRILKRSLETGNIERVIKEEEVFFRLTSSGKKQLIRDFPLTRFQKMRWDRRWRIVIFDIEEKRRKTRNQLRTKLKGLGLGMLQESVWISPFDITADLREFLKSIGLEEQTFVLIAHRDLGDEEKRLAQRVWRLDKLNEKYKEILKTWEEGKLESKSKADLARELHVKYLEVLTKDPFLPRELLPSDWVGEKVRQLMKNLRIPRDDAVA